MSEVKMGTVSDDFVAVIEKVSSIVHKISGNRLGEKQAYMVETRVKKRMIELGISTSKEYLNYIEKNFESESGALVGLITTHHTFFFREFPHFEILKKMLPDLISQAKKRGDKVIKIWSAACSRGHEVYSLAMFFEYYLKEIDLSMSYKILGTDIDIESVKVAENGVYHQNEIKEIPMNFLGAHWAKGTGDISLYAKVKNSLRSKCEFKSGNLLKIDEVVKKEVFDVIFCRNVFIYFETHQIEQITNNLINHLQPNGIFFSGISEPLSGMKIDVTSIGPSSYMLKSAMPQALATIGAKPSAVSTPGSLLIPTLDLGPDIFKVLCVDDSLSILTLLKKVLIKENGFEVVATAINGLDAMEKMKIHKVDLVTLDIHMPEMDGVSYLEKNFNKSHPPVVIISSASRSDSEVAMKALKLGATDYVEKPALSNLEECGEEIRIKLRSAIIAHGQKTIISSFDKESEKHYAITSPDKKIRMIMASISDLPRLIAFFSHLDKAQPPTFIFFEGQSEILEAMAHEHAKQFKSEVVYFDKIDTKIECNKIYFADFKTQFKNVHGKYHHLPCSILVMGNISKHSAKAITEWKNYQLLLEDLGEKHMRKHPLRLYSTDIVPVTSFAYMSCHYLSSK